MNTLRGSGIVPVRLVWATAIVAPLALMLGGCPLFPTDNTNTNTNTNTNDNSNTNTNENDNKPGNSGLTGKFVGSSRCSLCHVNTHRNWADTLHARALESLERIGQDTNVNCIGCHTVGFGQAGGFVNRATTNDLAGVGCESCHGPGRDHVENVEDKTLRPPINIASSLCGSCHTGTHHPNFDDWQTSGHAAVTEFVAEELIAGGTAVNNCGRCHSGDVFYKVFIRNETVKEDEFNGKTTAQLTGISCAICHDPHMRTGNAPEVEDGRDYQLRYPEIAFPTPTNSIDATTDAGRFNICGQCHHDRGRDWTNGSRGPHHSVQANFYAGEMPVPVGDDGNPTAPLVPSISSVHLRASEQCATCHLYRQDFQSEQAPAISGHTFQVNLASCTSGAGCHSSQQEIETRKTTFQALVAAEVESIRTRLGDPATWQFTSEGGPRNQSGISDNVKKIRWMAAYIDSDGSGGIHNPGYVLLLIDKCKELLTQEGL